MMTSESYRLKQERLIFFVNRLMSIFMVIFYINFGLEANCKIQLFVLNITWTCTEKWGLTHPSLRF